MGKPEEELCHHALGKRKRKLERPHLPLYWQLFDEEHREDDEGNDELSLSLALQPRQRCNTSSTSENSEGLSSSSRTNFKECCGSSAQNNINLDLTIAICAPYVEHL